MNTPVSGPATPVAFHWLGAAGLAVSAGNRCVLIDPCFSRPPLWRLAFGAPAPDETRIGAAWAQLPGEVAAIAVGHTHIDHALDIPSIARRTQAPIFGSASLDALLGRAGLPQRVSVVRPRDCHDLPGLGTLTVYAGAHGGVLFGCPPFPGEIARTGPYPLRAREYRSGAVMVFDLTLADRRTVHVGSAGLPPEPLPEGPCDALFLCVPGWRAQPDYPAVFLRRMQPRRIVPIHFDRMTRPLDDPRIHQPDPLTSRLLNLPGFLARVQSLIPGTPVLLPRLWEPVAF